MTTKHLRIIAAGLFGYFVSGVAQSVEPFGATPQENALCSALIFEGKDKAFHSRLEPKAGWGHTHHWCDCVRFRYRALKAMGDKQAFAHNLNEAIGGCEYVIRNVSPGSRILPKVHVDKGRALKLRGDTGAAASEFQRALSLNLQEINAYRELSILQEESGQKAAARETVTLGLRHNPDAILLQKRYLELGGKEPFPEPIARVEPAPEKKAEEPDPRGLTPVDSVIQGDADSEQQDESPRGEQAGPPDEASVGSPCRFCPPEEIQRRWIESFKSTQEKKPE